MSLQRQLMIKEKIKDCMREKFRSYNPETRHMPFHHRLLGLENDESELFLIDLKTVKPNKGNFKEFKRTLLEWTAAELAREPEAIVNTIIGIPYNPYEPKPYERWTLKGMLDLQHDILIAEELWDFIGGEGTYIDLLDAFEEAGIELRHEIDSYFEKFR